MRTVKWALVVVLCGGAMGFFAGCYLPLGADSRLFFQNGQLVIGWDPFTDEESILP